MSGSIGGYSWGDLGNSISNLFGGGLSSSQMANNQAWLDQPEELQVTPGQEGGVDSGTWDTSSGGSGSSSGGGISNADVAKALGQLGAGGAKGAAAKTPTGAGSQSMNMAQSQAVRGGGAAGLDALVRMLNARRDALLPQPVGISASAQQRPTAGLLGF